MKSPLQIGIILLLIMLFVLTYQLKQIGGSHELSFYSSLSTNLGEPLAHPAWLTQTEAQTKNNE